MKAALSTNRWRLVGFGVVAVLVGPTVRLSACGPWLPEQILVGRQVILRTPVGDFAQEVTALTEDDGAPKLPPGLVRAPQRHPPVDPYEGVQEETNPSKKETDELRDALDHHGVPPERRDNLVSAYVTFRTELEKRAARVRQEQSGDPNADFRFDERALVLGQKPVAASPAKTSDFLPPTLAEGLPGEWDDYLEGAYRFWNDDLPGARAAWERLLARPQPQRVYCSTWAAYMLARIADDPGAPPGDNARRYQRVRELRAEGCRDLFNLASESCGWEGRLAYVHKDYPAAIRLYYLQAVSDDGDSGMIGSSLRAVASDAMGKDEADPEALAAAARDPFLRRVVTLYVACHRAYAEPEAAEPPPAVNKALETERAWLKVLTQSGVTTLREATPVAWAAYHQADYAQAAAWLSKAPEDNGLALWLRAKLALRDGKTDAAAAFFARAVHRYPAEIKGVSNPIDNASTLADDGAVFRTDQFHADLGILSLSRGDYTQALTALLRSGFWRDATYVAERVMTTEELCAYVRTNFPAPPPNAQPTPTPADDDPAGATPTPTPTALQAVQAQVGIDHTANPAAYSLRYLLARRLARDGRYADAREYYPAPLWPKFDEYASCRKLADSGKTPKAQRADALWRAAKIERWLGMELFGTENDPDWFVDEGSFEEDDYRQARLENPSSDGSNTVYNPPPSPSPPYLPPVGRDEKRRVAKDQVQPEARYHYRYRASDLAWKAAALMPDQQDATARVLASGGLWLESVHESKAADKFYLALLRRCGHTELGRAAEKTGKLPDVPHEEP